MRSQIQTNRVEGVRKMEAALALEPLQRVRRAMLVGRPTEKIDLRPVAAVAEAQKFLARLKTHMLTEGIDGARVEVGLVTNACGVFAVTMDDAHDAEVATQLAALGSPKIVGLVFTVSDGDRLEWWTRSFIKGRDVEQILDRALATQRQNFEQRNHSK
jgi:hypothetical protein